MGATDKLKAVLRLDIKQFRRDAKKAKGDVNDIGMAAEKTSSGAALSFGKIAVGITAISTAAIAAASRIEEISVALAKAEADASRFQQERLGNLANQANQQWVRDLMDVTPGLTSTQAVQQSLTQAGDYVLRGPEAAARIRQAANVVFSEPGQEGLAEQARIAGQTFAGAFGVEPEQGGKIIKAVGGVIGLQGAGLEQGLAQLGFAARESFATPGEFGEIITRAAGEGLAQQIKGNKYRRLVGLAARYAPVSADSPRLAAQAEKTIFTLTNKKTPLVKRVLAEAGYDPETLDPIDVAEALGRKLNSDPSFQVALSQETGMSDIIVRTLQRGYGEIGEKAARKSLAAFDTAQWSGVQGRLGELQKDPNAIRTRAEFQIQASEAQTAAPGTTVEATAIGRVLEGEILSKPGTQQKIDTLIRQLNKDQPGFFDTDAPFRQEQAQKLFVLNKQYPSLVASLQAIEAVAESDIKGIAANKRRVLSEKKRAANETKIIGKQADQVDAYQNATEDAIRFIRQVELGQTVSGTVDYGPGGNFESDVSGARPSDISTFAAGQAVVGGVDITEAAGGATINTQIINQQGPESSTQNNKTRTGND